MPKRTLEVDGFSLDVALSTENIADGPKGSGSHLLHDGFMRIIVMNEGTNLFWPDQFQFTLVIAKLVDADHTPVIQSEVHICLLGPEDAVTEIALVEDTFHGTHGIWLIIDIETPETKLDESGFSHMLMLNEMRVSA